MFNTWIITSVNVSQLIFWAFNYKTNRDNLITIILKTVFKMRLQRSKLDGRCSRTIKPCYCADVPIGRSPCWVDWSLHVQHNSNLFAQASFLSESIEPPLLTCRRSLTGVTVLETNSRTGCSVAAVFTPFSLNLRAILLITQTHSRDKTLDHNSANTELLKLSLFIVITGESSCFRRRRFTWEEGVVTVAMMRTRFHTDG